jgi:ABC-2 type transport system permease protein
MPKVLQWLTYLDPVRCDLIIIRATLLKGVGLWVLWPQLLALSGIAALLAVAVLRFRRSME